ncbi:type IV pilus biogenesis protein EbsA [Altericista sp. CCNU0014]|uniref:type IV pilus biogenesis protein EbsA n=1 Tax=Altericista sp. CCNU0014 TaxID=3082949 RepID=UPI0038514386
MGQHLSTLQPAPNRDVTMYLPYYQGSRRDMLALAMSLYQFGNFEGERTIEGGNSIPFLATWTVLPLPADLTRCRLQFSSDADLSYEVTLTNFEFVGFLIDVLINYKRSLSADFSKSFYRKLLRIED